MAVDNKKEQERDMIALKKVLPIVTPLQKSWRNS